MAKRDQSKAPLLGQHAIVTGAGRGIGASIALELARLGANITLMGRTAKRLEAKARELKKSFRHKFPRQKIVSIMVDVSAPESVAGAFNSARKLLGDPEILINNAGAVESAPFTKTDRALWERMIATNLSGVYLCTKEVVAEMVHNKYGRIVNIASTAGLVPYPYVSAYTAAKHGVIGLTKSLALELSRNGITVNAICPGFTDTDLVTQSIRKVAAKTGRAKSEIRAKYLEANLLGRFIKPEEVASLVAWLCLPSQEAITGQALVIDGGETVMVMRNS